METMPSKESRKAGACYAPASYFEFFGCLAESGGSEGHLTLTVDDCIAGLRGLGEERVLLRGLFLEVPREPAPRGSGPIGSTPRGSAPRMRIASIVEHCAERAQIPSSPQNLHQRREDDILRECDEKHPFRPSLTITSNHHPQRQRPDKTSTRLYQSWKYKVEDRKNKILSARQDEREELANQISESRALPQAVALLHLKKNRQILQERVERGGWIKRHNDLGPDVDAEWTATPFSRAALMDRIFLRLTGGGDWVSAVELWTFLQAMSDHVETEADGPWTASGFERIERFVECTEEVLGWQWKNSEEGSKDVLINAEQFQVFLNSPDVWQDTCPDDAALHICYRDLLAQITRPRLIKELFQKLDVDRYQVLHSKHLLHFARLYGFQGDEREWAAELEDLRRRFHWGEKGAALGHFAALVSARDAGTAVPSYFCSSLRIDYLLAQLEERPPSLGEGRQVSRLSFKYCASLYTPPVEFSPLSSLKESPRWEAPPRSPRWRGQASPGSVRSPGRAGSPRSPPRSPGSPASPRWPAEEPASVVFKDPSLDSFHQLLGDLKIPSAAEILSGGGPASARA